MSIRKHEGNNLTTHCPTSALHLRSDIITNKNTFTLHLLSITDVKLSSIQIVQYKDILAWIIKHLSKVVLTFWEQKLFQKMWFSSWFPPHNKIIIRYYLTVMKKFTRYKNPLHMLLFSFIAVCFLIMN